MSVPYRANPRRSSPLPEAVLFDMDDTIFDHSLTARSALARLRSSESFLRSRPLDEVWHEYLRLLEAVHTDVLSGRVSVQEARAERFRKLSRFCGVEVTREVASELSLRYRGHYQKLRRTVPGVRRVLERLQGRTVVGVVTNNEVAEQEEKLDFLRLRSFVDFMVVSQAVGVTKPDPEIFRLALERAKTGPGAAVMVGDSWTSDIVGARNAGIRPVWFNRFHLSPPDPWPVRELDSFRSSTRTEAALSPDSLGPSKRV